MFFSGVDPTLAIVCNLDINAQSFSAAAVPGMFPSGVASVQLRHSVQVSIGGQPQIYGSAALTTFNFVKP
jgi:hypothetical protein